jgi:hypothetical protein
VLHVHQLAAMSVNLAKKYFSVRVHVWLTLSLLISYIYIYMELLLKPEILTSYIYIYTHIYTSIYMDLSLATLKAVFSICCTMFQHSINAESFPVSQLCVNTLAANKITLIKDGI